MLNPSIFELLLLQEDLDFYRLGFQSILALWLPFMMIYGAILLHHLALSYWCGHPSSCHSLLQLFMNEHQSYATSNSKN